MDSFHTRISDQNSVTDIRIIRLVHVSSDLHISGTLGLEDSEIDIVFQMISRAIAFNITSTPSLRLFVAI